MKKVSEFKTGEIVEYTIQQAGRSLRSKPHEVIESYLDTRGGKQYRYYALKSLESNKPSVSVEESRVKVSGFVDNSKKPSIVKATYKEGDKIVTEKIAIKTKDNKVKSKSISKVKTKVMAVKKRATSKAKTTAKKTRKAPTKKVVVAKAKPTTKRKVERLSTGMKLASKSEATKLQGLMELARKCMVEGKDAKSKKKIENQLGTIKEGIKTGNYSKEVITFMTKARAQGQRIYKALKDCKRTAETTKFFNDGIATFKGASKSKGLPETI